MKIREIRAVGLRGGTPEGGWSDELERDDCVHTLIAVFTDGALTVALLAAGLPGLLPGTWLLLYGTGVVTGGAFSVRVIPAMGLAFMALGILGLAVPETGQTLMVVGFGGLHLGFGAIIAWRYGG